jgi:hypothetical protein
MISDKTIVTTQEILALTRFSEQYLGRLEHEGIISAAHAGAAGRCWPQSAASSLTSATTTAVAVRVPTQARRRT